MALENDLLIPGLPNEIGILCLARVPRAEHLKMSGICRGWRNLLHSREFSEVRRELSLVQEWLYLWSENGNIWCCYDPSSKKWSKLPAMLEDNRIVHCSGIASVDGKIFVIGGAVSGSDSNGDDYVSCKTVSYFDARSFCWRRAADLNVARRNCMTGVIGNQIYVSGGFTGDETTSTAEVYNLVTDTWNMISNMKTPMESYDSVVLGEKLYAVAYDMIPNTNGFVYGPQTDSWENMRNGLKSGWECTTTVLDGKLYTMVDAFTVGNGDEPAIQVYNPSIDVWEIVEEIWDAGMATFLMGGVELVSFCGKLCLVSVETSDSGIIIVMVALEVKESTEGPSCSMTSSDRFLIRFEGEQRGRGNTNCQVIAL